MSFFNQNFGPFGPPRGQFNQPMGAPNMSGATPPLVPNHTPKSLPAKQPEKAGFLDKITDPKVMGGLGVGLTIFQTLFANQKQKEVEKAKSQAVAQSARMGTLGAVMGQASAASGNVQTAIGSGLRSNVSGQSTLNDAISRFF